MDNRHLAQRVAPIALLVLAAVSVPAMILSPDGLARLHRLEAEKEQVDEEAARLAQEIRRLRAEAKRLKTDPAAVERVARDELGLVRQTEVVFQFKQ